MVEWCIVYQYMEAVCYSFGTCAVFSYIAEDTEVSGASDGGEIQTTTTSPSASVSALILEQETHPPPVAPPIKFSLQINDGIL